MTQEYTGSGNIILIGMPGSGKSTVGPILAHKTGMGFIDTDHLIRQTDGRELGDIVKEEGYERFLELQQRIIISQRYSNHVIATGGSVVKSDALMQHFRKTGTVVYLDQDPSVLESRLDPGRRLARAQGQSFRDVYEERRPFYIKYADRIIDCSSKSTEEIVREIIDND
jgi:shikimate kinase